MNGAGINIIDLLFSGNELKVKGELTQETIMGLGLAIAAGLFIPLVLAGVILLLVQKYM